MQEGIKNLINSKSKTFLAFCSFFVLGTCLPSLLVIPPGISMYLFFGIFVMTAFSVLFWDAQIKRFIAVGVLLLIIGIWRYSITIPDCENSGSVCNYNSQLVTTTGIISAEPIEKSEYVDYIIKGEELSGKIMVRTARFPAYEYGDLVTLRCKLEKPESSGEKFRYDKYLARFGVYSVCNYPEITKIGEGRGNYYLFKILSFKKVLSNRLSELWPEPEASLMGGLLYGGKNSLPKNVSDNFKSTGVSHVVAVSGFNITIIVVALMSVLIFLGMYRQHAFYVVLATTSAFVILTGLSASAVRAGVMGTMVLVAQQAGRRSHIFNLLILTMALMQAANPYFLFWDTGFQLSFLATMGLVYISPILEKYRIPKVLTPTLSAIISTLPLILYSFGNLSLVAPLTNILILWLIPWIMLGGAITISFSYLFFPLGKFLAFITHLGLSYVIMVVEFLGGRSWSSTELDVPLWVMFILYIGIIFSWKKLAHSPRL